MNNPDFPHSPHTHNQLEVGEKTVNTFFFLYKRTINACLCPFHQLSKALYLPSLVIEITLIKPQIVGRTECWVLSVDD